MAYTAEQFLTIMKPLVIADMKQTGILASLTGAQALIESNKGNSGLAQKGNNLFGIKGQYNGQSVVMKTTEYYNGVKTTINAAFRKYPSWVESIADHSALFNRLVRYANLRGCTNYAQACTNVQADGYATSPVYANTLINTINKYRLYGWDAEALGKVVPIQPAITYPVLHPGERNDYILHWQKYLNLLGYQCGLEDGYFGENMKIAVMEYQVSKGLEPDGIIGKKTWGSLNLAA